MLPEDMRYNFRALYERYDRVYQRVFHRLNDLDTFDAVAYEDVKTFTKGFFKASRGPNTLVQLAQADDLTRQPVSPSPGDALAWALLPYRGRALTDECLDDILWRLASGYDFIAQGLKLASNFEMGVAPWMFLEIAEIVQDKPSRNGKPMLRLGFRALSPPFSGLRFEQRIPHRYVLYQVGRDLGFPRFKPLHPLQLVRAVLLGKVATTVDTTNVVEFSATDQIKNWNRTLRKRRETCPYDYRWPCHLCTKGYVGPRSCAKATHPLAYVERECPGCTYKTGQLGWFDPRIRAQRCVNCRDKEARRRARLS